MFHDERLSFGSYIESQVFDKSSLVAIFLYYFDVQAPIRGSHTVQQAHRLRTMFASHKPRSQHQTKLVTHFPRVVLEEAEESR